MTTTPIKFKHKVNERICARCAQVGFYKAKTEFSEIIKEEYLIAQSELKAHQDKYHEHGLIDYYRMQYRLIELRENMLKRDDVDWSNSMQDSKIFGFGVFK
ncbi:TPA: hypothetical protein IXT03_002875 [Enterococcus faecium]|nr:hypothetical protein [Enterococcus faecium]